MTVREILLWLANKDDTIDYDTVEKDLRSAFIREASVKTLHIKTTETARNEYGVWNECEVNGVPQQRDGILRHLPDGDYALVPMSQEAKS